MLFIKAKQKLDFLFLRTYTFSTISYSVSKNYDHFIDSSGSFIIFIHNLTVNSETFRDKLFILFFF